MSVMIIGNLGCLLKSAGHGLLIRKISLEKL